MNSFIEANLCVYYIACILFASSAEKANTCRSKQVHVLIDFIWCKISHSCDRSLKQIAELWHWPWDGITIACVSIAACKWNKFQASAARQEKEQKRSHNNFTIFLYAFYPAPLKIAHKLGVPVETMHRYCSRCRDYCFHFFVHKST